ncbi:MAG: hemolysin family protein [Candidatus Geothermincolia bacterium]
MSNGDAIAAKIAGLIVLVGFSGFLAASEIALVSVSPIVARKLADEGRRHGRRLSDLLQRVDRFLPTILVLTLLCQLGGSALATSLAFSLNFPFAAAIATGAMTLVIFIFAEMAPKTFATNHPEGVALRVSGVISGLSKILYPMIRSLIVLSNGIIRLFGGKTMRKGPFVTEGDIRALVTVAEEQEVIEEQEKLLIDSIFEFTETLVREVMVPRPDMMALEDTASLEEALETIMRTGFSRIPVFHENLDDIVGILYAKDLLPYLKRGEMDLVPADIMRDCFFIPETKRVSELLTELRGRKMHIAIALDEYGGTAGLVTIEDLVEEIVGEIFDEYDREIVLWEQLGEDRYRFDARISIDDLNDILDMKLPSEEWDTLGGLFFNLIGKVPKPGDAVDYDGITITAEKLIGRRISKLRIEKRSHDGHDEA